jgi:hypothetical protein
VISPTVSPPRSIPSNRRCAVFIVRSAENPSLRDASCCKVEVLNGGAGFRPTCFFSIPSTERSRAWTSRTARRAAVSSRSANLSRRLPSSCASRALNVRPSGVSSSASTVQYSCARKAWISASRSQISRSATDCTRPADEPDLGSLRHSTGESRKPTK